MSTTSQAKTNREIPPSFEPLGIKARYKPPRATIDPDKSKGWMRRILPIILAHKGIFITSLVCAFIALLIQIAIPRVLMQTIDQALVVRKTPLMFFIWVLFGLAAGRGVFALIYRYLLYRTAYLIEFDLRAIIYEHLTKLSFSFFDQVQSGQIISRSNSDIRALQMFLVFGPFMIINMFTFLIALGLMLTIHVPLAIVSLLPLPLVYVFALRMRQLMFPISWIVMARMADLATIVEENVTGVRIVKSFAAERHQIKMLAKAAQALRWAALRQINIRAAYSPLMENLPRLAMALVLLYGGYLAIAGQVTIGTLVAFNSYVIMLQAPFRMLGFLMMMSQRSAASAKRIFEILDTQPEIRDHPGAVDLNNPVGEVKFDKVVFSYNNGPEVLSNFSMRIAPGETVAVVGRTGSGKTTLTRLLPRFYDADSGAIQ
ncbi:MAG TPA: ABC transporter ATP-binding protein, partial [Desulfobacteraceae bacterium]|nr:ABC transporter ATP-binding protein [Desulfobacteraceae bacterium]